MRIIYVEDDAANVALLERICNMRKDELITYRDADSALSEVEPGSMDLMIIDLNLGNQSVDGLELTRMLRRKGIDAPIIAITSYDHLYLSEYLDAGCDEYVQKPVSVGSMLNLIDTYRP